MADEAENAQARARDAHDEAVDGLRNVRTRFSDVSARLQNLRNLLNSERHTAAERRVALQAFDQEVDNLNLEQPRRTRSSTVSRMDNDRRRPSEQGHTPLDVNADESQDATGLALPMPQGLNPSNLVRTRRRAFRPSERLTRSQRERLGQGGSAISSPSYSALPRVSSPSPNLSEQGMRGYTSDSDGNRDQRSRAKRRKLDDGSYEDEASPISYGYKGQVVPGQLRFEIASCDGGEYTDPQMPTNSWPQNVLQDDASVYCTKSNRCNMLLKHVSAMPFTLTKMVVKAPSSGYDSPIQEGMIFVAMDDETLLEKTARYEMHYSPKNYRFHRQRIHPRPSQDYLNSTRSPLRSIDRSRYLRDPHHPWPHYLENDPILDSAVVPGFQVSTGDPSDDEEPSRDGPSTPRHWHDADANYSFRSYYDRYRPTYTEARPSNYDDPSAHTSDSEDGNDDMLDHLALNRMRLHIGSGSPGGRPPEDYPTPDFVRENIRRYAALQATNRRREHNHQETAGYERLSSDPESSSGKVNGDADTANAFASASDTVAPHARFFIARNKSSVAIKFDPPVSGRYILIKLWASCPNANIDIQSITAHGYGGPRFFPALEMR